MMNLSRMPVCMASSKGRLAVVTVLVEHGADVNAICRDYDGNAVCDGCS